MYGLIIESIIETIKTRYGDRVWQEVRKKSKIEQEFFNTHQQYSEATVQKILRCLTVITSIKKIILILINFIN
jgi:hypothetical protein